MLYNNDNTYSNYGNGWCFIIMLIVMMAMVDVI